MNIELKDKMIADLKDVQKRCKAKIITESQLISICETAENKVKELMQVNDKLRFMFEYHDGEVKKGYSYPATCLQLSFDQNGEVRNYNIHRRNCSSYIKRLFFNDQEFDAEEKKELKKQLGANNHYYIHLN